MRDSKEENQTPNPEPQTPPAAEETPRTQPRYWEKVAKPSVKIERADITIISDFSKIIAQTNKLSRLIEKLRAADPSFAPERVFDSWESNIKETNTVMQHEFVAMRNGRVAKKYDARYVCVECNSVFMVPLPEDGICDACRAAKKPRITPY